MTQYINGVGFEMFDADDGQDVVRLTFGLRLGADDEPEYAESMIVTTKAFAGLVEAFAEAGLKITERDAADAAGTPRKAFVCNCDKCVALRRKQN